MDYPTLTADQYAAIDADGIAALPLDETSSSSSVSSLSSASSPSSNSSPSSSSSSSRSSASSMSSASSPSSKSSDTGTIVSGPDYLFIAEAYAEARSRMLDTIAFLLDTVQTVVFMNEVIPTLALLEPFYDAYQSAQSALSSTSLFTAPIRALQRHVERESKMDIVSWLEANVPAGVPAEFAALSKRIGWDIDSMIERTSS